ncbi:MAG: hypothetical protein WC797_02305 [Candidatus Paceibacterota bacterium]
MQHIAVLLEVENVTSKLGFMERAPESVLAKIRDWLCRVAAYVTSVGGSVVTEYRNSGCVRLELPDERADEIIDHLEKDLGCKPRKPGRALLSV